MKMKHRMGHGMEHRMGHRMEHGMKHRETCIKDHLSAKTVDSKSHAYSILCSMPCTYVRTSYQGMGGQTW